MPTEKPQREDTPKTGPAPGERQPAEPRGERTREERFQGSPEQGHEEIGQLPDTADFGPDDVSKRRG